MVRGQRAFLGRAVRWLAGEAGVRQFLDIGTGIPSAGNAHEVAQEIAPEARILYVDNDPIVLAHSQALVPGTHTGTVEFIQADLREPEAILTDPAVAKTLDLSQPVGLVLVGIMHHLRDSDDPRRILATLVDVAGGRDAGADVQELADPGLAGQPAHGPAEEGPLGPHLGADGGHLLGDGVAHGPVGGEVVLAAQPVVVDARGLGDVRVDLIRHVRIIPSG
jgi:hypothetical protein